MYRRLSTIAVQLAFLGMIDTALAHGDDAPVNETLNNIYKYAMLTTPLTVLILMIIYFRRYAGNAPVLIREEMDSTT